MADEKAENDVLCGKVTHEYRQRVKAKAESQGLTVSKFVVLAVKRAMGDQEA